MNNIITPPTHAALHSGYTNTMTCSKNRLQKNRIFADRQLQLAIQVVCISHRSLRPYTLTNPNDSNRHAVPWTDDLGARHLAKMRWDQTIFIEKMLYSWIHPRVAPKLRNQVVEVASILEKTSFYSAFSVTEYLSFRNNLAGKVNAWLRATAIRIAKKKNGLQKFLPALTRQKKSLGAAAA
eukprot:CAMPEP_0196810176 /NCGR_PEP_ID=MMETSP1362-20130617/10008_1 /TAXON_ID=163516 /ORGANISM="Leptocylindrus danicus, Strain CCMP1856" /LENGTH=180 /DNA_ID=CAMNT_0042185069 /DNA_START=94 /DNA_END=636 /DNA_ORIENTATION=+